MKDNTSILIEIDEELENLKAYGVLSHALAKDLISSGNRTDGSDEHAAYLISKNITAICNRIADMLNGEE
jgi:hypothetical protein